MTRTENEIECPLCGNWAAITAAGTMDPHQLDPNVLGGAPCEASGQSPLRARDRKTYKDTLAAAWKLRQAGRLDDRPMPRWCRIHPLAVHLLLREAEPPALTWTPAPLRQLFGIEIIEDASLEPGQWKILDGDGNVLHEGIMRLQSSAVRHSI